MVTIPVIYQLPELLHILISITSYCSASRKYPLPKHTNRHMEQVWTALRPHPVRIEWINFSDPPNRVRLQHVDQWLVGRV